ncbi:tight adherence pilus pseudopilin TadF [Photobacterium proteolyticum]|uniref:tight adherence pilus pseudopilin TadF n=1 Tax=Photobacterium proteolyticum TaxID=1903952 RepID=UPI001588086B|nr:tight adherence pilus pseudopilin TadF [Photobacterium proteolyticum]
MNRNCKGVFTIELAMILIFISSVFALQANYLVSLSRKSALDRASYSAVSIVSERKQLYSDEGGLCESNGIVSKCPNDIDTLFSIVSSTLTRTISNFDEAELGFVVEEYIPLNNTFQFTRKSRGDVNGCNFPSLAQGETMSLSPITSKNRKLPLYQVSICYHTSFNVIGATELTPFHLVSSSFSFARF